VFIWNVLRSVRTGEHAGDDPWDGWTLEWATTSPPPPNNFVLLPPIISARPLWDLKRRVHESTTWIEPIEPQHVEPTLWPLIVAVGLALTFVALLVAPVWTVVGAVVCLAAIIGWTWPTEREAPP
jgi:cytochrome c oxidase subunit 1